LSIDRRKDFEQDDPLLALTEKAEIVKTTYLETSDVNGSLDALRQELEKAIANNERIRIR
jgi:hypothetical protein